MESPSSTLGAAPVRAATRAVPAAIQAPYLPSSCREREREASSRGGRKWPLGDQAPCRAPHTEPLRPGSSRLCTGAGVGALALLLLLLQRCRAAEQSSRELHPEWLPALPALPPPPPPPPPPAAASSSSCSLSTVGSAALLPAAAGARRLPHRAFSSFCAASWLRRVLKTASLGLHTAARATVEGCSSSSSPAEGAGGAAAVLLLLEEEEGGGEEGNAGSTGMPAAATLSLRKKEESAE